MSQIFHHSTNTLSKVSIFGAVFIVGGVVWLTLEVNRSSYVTRAHEARGQPVPFSHAHHVGGLGLDCRYCHTSVDKSAFAGIPPTKTCMNCHSQIWAQSPTLEPVRASLRNDTSIEWVKVHDLPDFAYFNHSAHVNKGVGCSTCHGRVDQMPLVWQEKSLQMEWCLECHRTPERFLRPKSEVYNIAYEPPANQLELGRTLVKDYNVKPQVTCTTCHR
jgi:Cytochrome c7 and related cytochrome c